MDQKGQGQMEMDVQKQQAFWNAQKERINVTRSFMPPYEEFIEAIKPLWESRWLTNMGLYHQQLERELAAYLDVPRLSLTVNGHLALELCLQAFDFPEGGEVITTPFTFISTTHAILRNRLTPVFCDVKESDGTMDERKIEALITDRTVAILPVHVYGHACAVEEIGRIAAKHGLKLIYDAAHAFSVKCQGRGIGNYGDASIFSFHATKVYHTIEGGAVVCNDPAFYQRLYNLKNFGIRDEETVVFVGANAKMNEFAAIMGLCNLRHADQEIALRRAREERYRARLSACDGIRFFSRREDASWNAAYAPVLIGDGKRDAVFQALDKEGISARKYFYPLTADAEVFGARFQNAALPAARKLSEAVLCLPLYSSLPMETVDRIAGIVADALGGKGIAETEPDE